MKIKNTPYTAAKKEELLEERVGPVQEKESSIVHNVEPKDSEKEIDSIVVKSVSKQKIQLTISVKGEESIIKYLSYGDEVSYPNTLEVVKQLKQFVNNNTIKFKN